MQALTTIGDAAQARANAAPATASGRKLAQLPAANDPSKPAQPFGYRRETLWGQAARLAED